MHVVGFSDCFDVGKPGPYVARQGRQGDPEGPIAGRDDVCCQAVKVLADGHATAAAE